MSALRRQAGRKADRRQTPPVLSELRLRRLSRPKAGSRRAGSKGDRLVLIRRANEPAIANGPSRRATWIEGSPWRTPPWREVKEETGLDVRLNGLVGLYSTSGNPVVLAVYTGEIVGGKLEPGHDAQEAGLFSHPTYPHWPSPATRRSLKTGSRSPDHPLP